MKKLKIPLLVCLVLGVLVLVALLPKLVSAVLDARLHSAPAYCDMLSIQLSESTEPQPFSGLDRLAFLSLAETANVSQEQMRLREEDVREAVTAFIGHLQASGLCPAFAPSHTSMQPKLMYSLSDPTQYLLVWTVTMLDKGEPHQQLMLDVDDATGQILCFSYSNYQQYTMDGVWDRNKAVADTVAALYFSQFWPPEAVDPAAGACVYYERDGGVTEVVYTLDSALFGRFRMQFTVDGAGGFSLTFFS